MLLQTLQEQTLRRLYKFVLRRAIGRFLKSDSVLEEVNVNLSEGRVELGHLELDENVLNESAAGLPLRVVRASVAQINAKFPYSNLLEESCTLHVEGIVVDVVPAQVDTSPKSHPKARKQPSKAAGESPSQTPFAPLDASITYDEGQESLGFLAQWIEQILSQLRASAADVTINLYDSDEESCLSLHIERADFTPCQGVTTSVPGHSLMPQQSSPTGVNNSIIRLVTQQMLRVQGLSLVLVSPSGTIDILRITQDAIVNIRSRNTDTPRHIPKIDVDVGIRGVTTTIGEDALCKLVNIAAQYASKGVDRASLERSMMVSDNTVRTLEWLERNQRGDGSDSEIDFGRLAQLMAQYEQARTKLQQSFNGADTVYHEALTSSALDQSVLMHGNEEFLSAVQAPADYQSEPILRLRTHISDCDVKLSCNTTGEENTLVHKDLILSLQDVTAEVQHCIANTQITASASKASLAEHCDKDGATTVTTIVSFSKDASSMDIIAAPHLSVNVTLTPRDDEAEPPHPSCLEVSVELEPIILSLHMDLLEQWSRVVARALIINSQIESQSDLKLNVSLPLVTVIVHSATATMQENPAFASFLQIAESSTANSRWLSLQDAGLGHVTHHAPLSAALSVAVEDLNINFSTQQGRLPVLRGDACSATGHLVFKDDDAHVWALPVMRLESNVEERLQFYQTNRAKAEKAGVSQNFKAFRVWEAQDSAADNLHEAEVPVPEVSDVLEINAPLVSIDLYNHEYVALLELFDTLSSGPSSSEVHDKDQRSLQASNASAKKKKKKKGALGVTIHAGTGKLRMSGTPDPRIPSRVVSYLLALDALALDICNSSSGEFYIAVTTCNFSLFERRLESRALPGLKELHPLPYQRPILHRTTIMTPGKDTTSSGFSFRFQLLLVEEAGALPDETVRSLSLHLNLQDVTLQYTIDSSWVFDISSLLSVPSDEPSAPRPQKFGVTRLHITLSQAQIAYSCPDPESCALLTIGLVRVSSNLVSTISKQVFKIALRDLELHLSNRSQRPLSAPVSDGLEQRPYAVVNDKMQPLTARPFTMDEFIDANGFVKLCSLDLSDIVITADETSQTYLKIDSSVGLISIYACADSFHTLTSTIDKFTKDFTALSAETAKQTSSASTSPKPRKDVAAPSGSAVKTPAQAVPIPTPVAAAAATAAPFKDVAPRIMHEIVPDMFHPNRRPAGRYAEAQAPQGRGQLSSAPIIDDYYNHPSASGGMDAAEAYSDDGTEFEARWLPQYEDDDEYGDNESLFEPIVDNDNDQRGSGDFDETNTEYSQDESRTALSELNLDADELELELADIPASYFEGLQARHLGDVRSTQTSTYDYEASPRARPESPKSMYSVPYSRAGEFYDAEDGLAAEDEDDDVRRAWANRPVSDQQTVWYDEQGEMKVYPHHIPIPEKVSTMSDESIKIGASARRMSVIVRQLNLRLRLFKGNDWVTVGEVASSAVPSGRGVSSKAVSKKGSSDVLGALMEGFDQQLFASTDSKKRSKARSTRALQNQQSVGRRKDHLVEFSVQYFAMRLHFFDRDSVPGSERIPSMEVKMSVIDWYIASSKQNERPRKVLGYWRSSKHPREVDKPMTFLHVIALKVGGMAAHDGTDMGEELRVRVSMLPLRAHLDAHVIDFFKTFFGISSQIEEKSPRASDEQLEETLTSDLPATSTKPPLFIQLCEVMPVKIKADYHPTAVDMKALSKGDYMQLLNLFPLDGLELEMARVRLTGVSGMAALVDGILMTWVQDIYAHQLHRVISGTLPLRSIANIGSSLSDLILIPLDEYKKSGKVMRGIQKGTQSFLRTVTRETLDVSQRFTSMLAHALGEVTNDQPSQRNPRDAQRQPVGVIESLERAYDSVSRELNLAMDTIVAVPMRQYKRTGPGGYVKSVVRAVPIAVLRPVVGATEAISYTLLGLRNRVDPQLRREEEDMWNVSHQYK